MPQSAIKKIVFFSCAVWILNLIQAGFTQLIFDEAYYWYYAQQLAWGYFDHPPMVAWMIYLGGQLFSGELGVRLLGSLMSAAIIPLLWILIPGTEKSKYVREYLVLIFSLVLVHAYGFFSLPDTPLLFFSVVFFLAYKNYLVKETVLSSVLLGLSMAALMYSKYHGGLIIVFVIASNPRLALKKSAWLAVVISLMAYAPHLFWLYENDFVSLKYHLFERPNRAYEFGDFTAGFFLNLVLLFGLTFPWVYRAIWIQKPSDRLLRALKTVAVGVILFFFLSSFQRRVQTQWLIVVSLPMAVFAFLELTRHMPTRKWIWRLGLINIAILLFLRIGLVYPPLFPKVYESHGNKEWVSELVAKSGGVPVVFENSYRYASMFQFYSGLDAFSLNHAIYRQNQYTIDQSESRIQDRRVVLISTNEEPGDLYFLDPNGEKKHGKYIQSFQSARKLRTKITSSDSDEITFEIYNPYTHEILLKDLSFGLVYLNAYKQVLEIIPIKTYPSTDNAELLPPGGQLQLKFKIPKPQGEIPPVYYKITIGEYGLSWGLNGENQKITP